MLFASCALRSESGSKSRVGSESEKGCGLHIHARGAQINAWEWSGESRRGTIVSALLYWKELEGNLERKELEELGDPFALIAL